VIQDRGRRFNLPRVGATQQSLQVRLSGEDGNAYSILGRTTAALRAAGVPQEEIDTFFAEATSGDYDHLLQTTMRWVDVE
jgi:hypothetical protein